MQTNAYPGQTAGSAAEIEAWLNNPDSDSDLSKIKPTYYNSCTYNNTASTWYGHPDQDVASFPAADIYGNAMQSLDYQASLEYHLKAA